MKLPQFTAEASLAPARALYAGGFSRLHSRAAFQVTGTIKTQLAFGVGTVFGGDCFGSVDQCLNTFCVNLPPGKQKAECFAACQQPSVCSGCRCSCTPDCVRTCEVECTKSTTSGSDTLRCTKPCVPLPGFPFPGSGFVSTNL
jgi:hypothetical protein